ncbi:flagellar motor switch protein FliG [Rhodopseudomonas julia]|uniref:Flagellar motor switch protein FliG n=1 Tax=Rhodopseudomonas julia TaxID=200617 RepID=A0ABU0C6Y7_9BRAD|nr:flagellar motor switch protein FliG [Rhodopseudomonas julia]MDQ0326292.1 flagellar motor switch protein FliG [Rhodopseudomonas julia]
MAATANKPPAMRPLQGPDRVAALLMAMGKPAAARVMKHFDPDEIKVITRSVATLKSVPPQQIEQLIEEFASNFLNGAQLVGTTGEVEKLLEGVLPPDQIGEIMADVMGNASRSIWDRMSNVSENLIAAYIMKEHPQTAALILSKVKPTCAAKVMGHLPPDRRNEVMRRMLGFKPMVDETMRIIERVVHEDFMTNLSRNQGADPHAKMADIVNKMERDHMEDVLNSLSESRPKSAEILKSLLFTFDDISKLTPKARTTLFDRAPTDKVVMSLKGTDAEFREIILSSLSSRVRRMVEQELSSSEPAPHREVTDARRVITDMALDMAGKGEIDLNSDNEEDAYVM